MSQKKIKIKSVCSSRKLRPCQESSRAFSGCDSHTIHPACWQLMFKSTVETLRLFHGTWGSPEQKKERKTIISGIIM